ncbi:hypothetical protein OG500_28300 [Kitasatospora sp. NBC_01250]|uniref:DUF6879 family protein n=1 Tax=unclassified Kitasatospora TaxID=2633591 RepID=UPI002E0D2BAB|nr:MULTISPECIES: DUF6879 family protein [unclassified Kitasatospora]WSJ69987.1 hypothetical protein OG294_29960 [Kitasatospora sp. NBC_01302]
MLQSSEQPQTVPDFAALLRRATRSAAHLEMRDLYSVGDESEIISKFKRTGKAALDPTDPYWAEWLGIVREAVGRGVVMRRARIVSEPVTDYIRWEHAVTPLNLNAGEQVRWLPRRLSSDIALPGNDLWLIDDRLIMFHWFTGDGDWAGHEFNEDPATVKMVTDAFEAVWARAIPHDQYAV